MQPLELILILYRCFSTHTLYIDMPTVLQVESNSVSLKLSYVYLKLLLDSMCWFK